MKFDSNRGWQNTLANVGANRDVLSALAGVFLVLPNFAFALFYPQPQAPAGMTPEQAAGIMQAYYVNAMPALMPVSLLQILGMMAMIILMTDRARPTVGQAIRAGAINVLPFVAVQLLIGMGLALAAIVLLVLATLSQTAFVIGIAYGMVLALFVYVGVRTLLAAPVIAAEGVRNPLKAIARSWALTGASSGRIAAFLILLAIAMIVVAILIMGVIGLMLALIAGGETARIVAALVSSVVVAVMMLYFAAAVVAIHRQLAGPALETAGAG